MATREVILKLEARISDARKNLRTIEKDFANVSKTSGRATDATARGFKRASTSVAGTTTAVTNLGRIIQDAPFGVLGVANNIEPFIQSFQDMGDGALTTRQKFTQLVKSAFTGPGALITAVSLASTLLIAFGDDLLGAGEKGESAEQMLAGINNEIDVMVQAIQKFKDIDDPFGLDEAQTRLLAIESKQQVLEVARDQILSLNEEARRIEDLAFGERGQVLSRDAAARFRELEQKAKAIAAEFGTIEQLDTKLAELETKRLETQQELNTTQSALNSALVKEFEIRQKLLEQARQARNQAPILQPNIDFSIPGQFDAQGTRLGGPGKPLVNTGSGAVPTGPDITDKQFRDLGFSDLLKDAESFGKQIEKNIDSWEKMGRVGKKSNEAAASSSSKLAGQITQAAAAQLLLADNAEEAAARVIDTLLAQITAYAIKSAMESLPFPANIAAAAGAALAARGLKELIPSFRTGVDGFEGGMAKVHGGEVITYLPPGANVITNENVQALQNMQDESRRGAANLMGMGGGIDPAIIERAIIEGMSRANVRISVDPLEEGLNDFKSIKTRVGNG